MDAMVWGMHAMADFGIDGSEPLAVLSERYLKFLQLLYAI
jgi:hypothetical protein